MNYSHISHSVVHVMLCYQSILPITFNISLLELGRPKHYLSAIVASLNNIGEYITQIN